MSPYSRLTKDQINDISIMVHFRMRWVLSSYNGKLSNEVGAVLFALDIKNLGGNIGLRKKMKVYEKEGSNGLFVLNHEINPTRALCMECLISLIRYLPRMIDPSAGGSSYEQVQLIGLPSRSTHTLGSA